MEEMQTPVLISSSLIEFIVLVHVSIVDNASGIPWFVTVAPQHSCVFLPSANTNPNNCNYRYAVKHHCGIFAI